MHRLPAALWILRRTLPLAVLGAAFLPVSALAELKVCNRTGYLLNVALGLPANGDFRTEGWWSIAAKSCMTPVREAMTSRFVYVYAIDIRDNEVLAGGVSMCVEKRKFAITGIADCWRRGYRAAQFAEIDTGLASDWTIYLEEGDGAARPAPPPAVP